MAACTPVHGWAKAQLGRLAIVLANKPQLHFWQKCKASMRPQCGKSCLRRSEIFSSYGKSGALAGCAAVVKKALITCIVVPEAAEEIQHLY